MNSYEEYVKNYAELMERARTMACGYNQDVFSTSRPHMCTFEKCAMPEPFSSLEKTVLIFSPHPDDECITGLLPLRLMVECGFKVKNVAVTLGSDKTRRAARLKELEGACSFFNWELILCGSEGLEDVNQKCRNYDAQKWGGYVDEICRILKENPAAVIFVPHGADANSTHRGVNLLVQDALAATFDYGGLVVETEYWGAMSAPNIMAEASFSTLGMLIAGLSFHEGEIARNDYHVRLPAWMSDNIRRGSELIGGQGSANPLYSFGVLYKSNICKNGAVVPVEKNIFLSQSTPATEIFKI